MDADTSGKVDNSVAAELARIVDERVVAGTANEDFVVGTPAERVVTCRAVEHVGACAAGDRVVARAGENVLDGGEIFRTAS